MLAMLEKIREFSYWLGVEPFWVGVLIDSLIALGIVKSIYPWTPKWKAKTTKDKDGNEITTYYHRDK